MKKANTTQYYSGREISESTIRNDLSVQLTVNHWVSSTLVEENRASSE